MSISPVAGVTGTSYLPATAPTTTSPVGDGGFSDMLSGAVNSLTQAQSTSNELAIKAVTGDLDDVHDYTVASAEAKLQLELTAAVRNKAVDAFTEIMRMQA
ncbi:flagellar hook-basal body complex protein FliE [Cellulomonas sp. NPDC089187]|uniref:flagellar hook-basal body complex protein FliE n=1 Tax=Cellulomonas sp. NPDC089187 TaxID=3154970 RepID=UPI003425C1EA